MAKQIGIKPIPLSLKIVSVFLILWILGSIMGLSLRFEQGLPLVGIWVTGITAITVVLLLDIIGPMTFLYALYQRKSWAPKVAETYIGLFILNSIIALFTFKEQLGTVQILLPACINGLFLIFICKNKEYFN